jgi:hypothetical protein
MQLPYAKMQYLGRELLPVSNAALVNFSSLVRVHKEKLQNGLLIINSAEGDCGIIHIEDGQWKLKNTQGNAAESPCQTRIATLSAEL